jgi:hypothetical protein
MSEQKNQHQGYLLLGVALAIGIIVSSFILSQAIKSRNYNSISVKGLAEKNIVSNIAVWEPQVQVWSANLSEAYSKIKQDADRFYNFLLSKGIPKDEITLVSLENTVIRKAGL